MITPIDGLSAISPAKKTEESAGQLAKTGEGSMFASIFQSAIQNVKDTDAEYTQAQYLLATGQIDNPSSVLIAFSKESTAVNLLIQLRNRALDAYSELTRMNM